MDDSTKKIAQVLATGIVKKLLIGGGMFLAGKGVTVGFSVADYAAMSTAIVAGSWSLWQDYGKGILLSKMEVWKAQALAQAAALKRNGIAQPTVAEIAAQHPTLTAVDVAKVTSNNVAPLVAPTAATALLIGLMLFHPSPAQAQKLTGKPIEDIQRAIAGPDKSAAALESLATALAKPFKDIADFIGSDATAAIAQSTVLPNLQDGHGQQCWVAMKDFGEIIKEHPVPITFHVINDYETLRLLGMATNNLCNNVHCTQVFADFTSMAQAASPMPLAIPSLHDLCTKVPQIAVVAPIKLPDAPPATTSTPAPTQTP